MHAHIGDQLVVHSPSGEKLKRDGEIIGLHHPDGTPPYDVRWSDTGRVTLVFPGPDAQIRSPHDDAPGPARPARREA